MATLAGIPAGFLVAGVGSRLAMRASGFMFTRDNPNTLAFTEAEARVGEITAEGTTFLLVFGTVLGLMAAYFYATLKPWLPGNALIRGLLFGLVALALMSPFALDRGNEDFQRFGDVRVNVALFASLFFVYGLLIALLDAALDRALPAKPKLSGPGLKLKQAISSVVLIAGIGLGLLMVQILATFLLVAAVGAESFFERFQIGLIFATLLVLLPAFLLFPLVAHGDGSHRAGHVKIPVRTIVYGSFALILAVGAATTAQTVITMLRA